MRELRIESCRGWSSAEHAAVAVAAGRAANRPVEGRGGHSAWLPRLRRAGMAAAWAGSALEPTCVGALQATLQRAPSAGGCRKAGGARGGGGGGRQHDQQHQGCSTAPATTPMHMRPLCAHSARCQFDHNALFWKSQQAAWLGLCCWAKAVRLPGAGGGRGCVREGGFARLTRAFCACRIGMRACLCTGDWWVQPAVHKRRGADARRRSDPMQARPFGLPSRKLLRPCRILP